MKQASDVLRRVWTLLARLAVGAIGIPSLFLFSVAAQTAPAELRQVEVTDPGSNRTAFTLEIPANWRFTGTILRPGGCHAPALPADGLSYAAVSPDNVTAIMQVPGAAWNWASDGVNPQGGKCAIVNISSAAGYLLNIAVLNLHPSATILGVVPLPPKIQEGLAERQRALQASGSRGMHNTLDTAQVRIEYNLNGQTVQEQLGTVVTCQIGEMPPYPMLHRAAVTRRFCEAHGVYVKRAPKGKLDELVARNLPNARIDKEWDAYISEKMREAFAAWQDASNKQFQAIQDHYRQVTAGMVQRGQEFNDNLAMSTRHALENDRATTAATSHMAHLQVLDSLNRQTFMDPTTGQRIETSNQYAHNWISGDGSKVVINNDPTFDPNGVIDPVRQGWTELIPVN